MNRMAKQLAAGAGLLFLCAMPVRTRAQSAPPAPVPTPPKAIEAGVKAIRGTVNSANWNYKYVAGAINDALKEMQKMEEALSTEAT